MTGIEYLGRRDLHPFWDGYSDPNREDVVEAYEQGKADGYHEGYDAGARWADSHPRWISVEDELPPKKTGEASDKVLVYDTETNRVGASWYFHSTGKWFNGWDSITHWMPLPSIETIINKQL